MRKTFFDKSAKINAIFRKHSNGRDLSDVPARNFTGIMTLLDAINRAGSTDPEKIRAELAASLGMRSWRSGVNRDHSFFGVSFSDQSVAPC